MYAVPGFATDLCQNGSLVDGDGPWGGGGYCNSKPCKAYFSALYGETETVRRDIVLHRFVYPLFERSLLQKPGSDKSRSMAGERQLKIQRSPVSKVRGTGRGEGGRTVCGNTFLEPVLKFADLAAHWLPSMKVMRWENFRAKVA